MNKCPRVWFAHQPSQNDCEVLLASFWTFCKKANHSAKTRSQGVGHLYTKYRFQLLSSLSAGIFEMNRILFEMRPSIHKFGLSGLSTHLPLYLFVFFFCLLSFAGCASLPRVENIYRPTDIEKEKSPDMIGPRGQLSPKRSKAAMERLKKQVGPTEI